MTISDPVIYITCSLCNCEWAVNQTEFGQDYWYENLIRSLEVAGWTKVDGLDYCPVCTKFSMTNR